MALEGPRPGNTPIDLTEHKEALLSASVIESARRVAPVIRTFFTQEQHLKIHTNAIPVLDFFITREEAYIPSYEGSREASSLIEQRLDVIYEKLVGQELRRLDPKNRSKVIPAHTYLRKAAEVMDEGFNAWEDLSFPEQEEAKVDAQRWIDKYHAKMGLPRPSHRKIPTSMVAVGVVGAFVGFTAGNIAAHGGTDKTLADLKESVQIMQTPTKNEFDIQPPRPIPGNGPIASGTPELDK